MVSGSCACTSMGNPKSVGKFPLTSCHESPASSLRITSQCFCMNSVFGRDGCNAMRCTQWPTSAVGSGICSECSPRLIGFHVLPLSSVRNVPAAEIAMEIRFGLFGSRRMVCKHMQQEPGCHLGQVSLQRNTASTRQDL